PRAGAADNRRATTPGPSANQPEIWLADEPTGNLDKKNGEHIFDLLLTLNRVYGTTLLLVTHDHHLADKADRRISLSGGRIVEDRLIGDGATGRRGDGATERQAESETEDELQNRPIAPSAPR